MIGDELQRTHTKAELAWELSLANESLGLIRQHLREVGIEATFADDVGELAAARIRALETSMWKRAIKRLIGRPVPRFVPASRKPLTTNTL